MIAASWVVESLRRRDRRPDTAPLLEWILAAEPDVPEADRVFDDLERAAYAVSLGSLRRDADDNAGAEAPLRLAVELRRRDTDKPAELRNALAWLGIVLRALDRPAEAEVIQLEAVAIARTAHGADSPLLANDLGNLGATYLDQYKYREAGGVLLEAMGIEERGEGVTDRILKNLGLALARSGQYSAGLGVRRRLLELREAATPRDPRAIAMAQLDIGVSLYALERYGEAEVLQRTALAAMTTEADRASALTDLAMTTHFLGRSAEAERLFREALAAYETAFGTEDVATAWAMLRLGQEIGARGDWDRAEPLLVRAHDVAKAADDKPLLADALIALGGAMGQIGRPRDALRFYSTAFTLRRDLYGAGHPDTIDTIRKVAMAMVELGDFEDAETYLRQIVSLRERAFGPDHPRTAAALQELAYALVMQDRHHEAADLMRRAVAIVDTGDDPRDRVRMRANLGVALIDDGQAQEGLSVLREAGTALLDRMGGPNGGQDARNDLNGLRYLFRHRVRAAWIASEPVSP